MVLICGEVCKDQLKVCLLEETTSLWEGHGQKFRVEAYVPKFLTIQTSKPVFKVKFCSESGQIRRGRVVKCPRSSWVVSCNNRHTIRSCTVWPKIAKHPADILFHLGDQIYADRVYWRWWRYLSSIPPEKWNLYKWDLQREYFREYYETWEPLAEVLAHTSNIMIPDDHEIRDQAEVWDYLIAGMRSEEANWDTVKEAAWETINEMTGEAAKDIPPLIDYFMPEESSHKSQLEKFLFQMAFEVCQNLYLGLRLTNQHQFDYFRVIGDVTVIMTERISQPFLGKNFWEGFEKFRPKLTSKILWLGGLPPCPVRPNFWELLIYRHVSDVPDKRYDQLYDLLFECISTSEDSSKVKSEDSSKVKSEDSSDTSSEDVKSKKDMKRCHGKKIRQDYLEKKCQDKFPSIILIGGDLHAGTQGRIYQKGNPSNYAKFHISSPSSGFPSAHIPQDCLDSTCRYQVDIDKYRPADPNAVWVEFDPFHSHHTFVSGSWADCWQNALSTAYVFWS